MRLTCKALLANLLLLSCGDDDSYVPTRDGGLRDGGVDDDCCSSPDSFPSLICIEGTCRNLCMSDAGLARGGCKPGHACAEVEPGTFVCDPKCDSALCEPQSECLSKTNECDREFVNCGYTVGCQRGGDICDPRADRCFPKNGDCSAMVTGGACPKYSEEVQAIATVRCAGPDFVCTLELKAEPPSWLAPKGSDPISVSSPSQSRATTFADGDVPTFSWRQTNTPVLVRVLDAERLNGAVAPDSATSFNRAVVWGLTVPKGEVPRASWLEGFLRENGEWVDATPHAPDPGVYLFVVLAISPEGVTAASPFIPFAVGDEFEFRGAGSDCTIEGVPGDCIDPIRPLACWDSQCRLLCASNLDCSETEECSTPRNGRRVCLAQ